MIVNVQMFICSCLPTVVVYRYCINCLVVHLVSKCDVWIIVRKRITTQPFFTTLKKKENRNYGMFWNKVFVGSPCYYLSFLNIVYLTKLFELHQPINLFDSCDVWIFMSTWYVVRIEQLYRNKGSLFYLTYIVCHLTPLFQCTRAEGLWVACGLWYASRHEVPNDVGETALGFHISAVLWSGFVLSKPRRIRSSMRK